jgi:outer membrane protein
MINVKYLKTIILTFLVIFLCTQSKSEIKIAFIEMDTIMNQSLAGKSLVEQLNKIDKNNKKNFLNKEEKLKLEKEKISSQKNILSKEEYEKKVLALNNEYSKYQKDVKKILASTKSKRDNGLKKILNELNILLSEYSQKNELTFIIDQKNIIIGKSDLNITSEILKLINSKIKKVSLN